MSTSARYLFVVFPEDGPSRETLAAQIEALKALVERQRRYIGSMRASHFWKLREAVFAFRRRFADGIEPLPAPTPVDLATEEAALGDPYQVFRIRERRSPAELEWLHRFVHSLGFQEPFEVIVNACGAAQADLEATLASLREQVYPHWRVQVLTEPSQMVGLDSERTVCAVDAGDLVEPDALLSLAFELHDGAAVVYSDEDRLDAAWIPREPSFKPDWSPETLLTRDYVGRLCAIRGAVLAAAGGLDPAHGTAMWYDALLRVTESTDRVRHVARVLYHRRHSIPPTLLSDGEAAVRRALARRGEVADVRPTPVGNDVQYAVSTDERVTVIIPTRDGAELLARCLKSLFERTAHPNFDVIVVDNGSREAATRNLFDRWHERRPAQFRVIEDTEPFNFSRLNNRAVATADAPYVLLLNNDTEVIAADWMTAMLGQARRAPIGAVGALLLYEDGSIQHAGVFLGGDVHLGRHAYRFVDSQKGPDERLVLDTNYLAVTGACMMVARAKYLEVGGLDEALAVTYNDIDLCLKLREAGYRNVVVPRAKLFHYESKSRGRDDTRRKVEAAGVEGDIFRERWTRWVRRDPYFNLNLSQDTDDFSVR